MNGFDINLIESQEACESESQRACVTDNQRTGYSESQEAVQSYGPLVR